MEPNRLFAFTVRAWPRLALLSCVGAAILLEAGCANRRSSYRPVFFNRMRATPCPNGDCGGATVSGGTVVTTPTVIPSEPGFSGNNAGQLSEPATSGSSGPAPFNFGTADDEPTDLHPVSPPRSTSDPSATRTQGNPVEPEFDRSTGSSRQSNRPRIDSKPGATTVPPETQDEPVLVPPSRTSLKNKKGLLSPQSRGLFRRNLQTYVNDPDDLFTPPRADRPWRYIVLHHSAHDAGSLAEIDADHRERLGTKGCGYHFVVGNGTESADGRIEVANRWSEQLSGQHCRDSRVTDINEYGIGVCLIGNFDDHKPTAKQLEATQALIAYLCDRYQIPEGNVVTHDVVARSASACPGKNFPVAELLGRDRSLARH